MIIDSSHWSKFLVFFFFPEWKSARFTHLHRQAVYAAETESEEEAFQAIRDFKSLKKKVLPLGVNPTRCLSTQPDEVVNLMMVQGCVSKKNIYL